MAQTTTQQVITDKTIALFLRNYALAFEGATVETNSEQTTGSLDAANLLDGDLDTAYRSGSLASQSDGRIHVTFDLGQPRHVSGVAWVQTNIRVPAKALFYSAPPDVAAPIYESDWIDPIVRGGLEDLGWIELDWDAGPSFGDVKLWTDSFALRNVHLAPEHHNVRYVRLSFAVDADELGQQPVDYLQIGQVFVSQVFRPSVNILLGWSASGVDESTLYRTEAGSLRGRQRSILREFAFSMSYQTKYNVWRRVLGQFIDKYGNLGKVFAWLEPSSRAFFYELSTVGNCTSLPTVAMEHLNLPAASGWKIRQTE